MHCINRIGIFSFFFLLISCSRSSVERELSLVESLLENRPDSALLVLESIPKESIQTHEARAYYSLLYAKALDKNYIDTTDYSVIRPAIEYYGEESNRKAIMSWYYAGIIQKNGKEYVPAMIAFEQAQRLAENNGEYHYLGLSLRAKAYILNETLDLDQSIDCCNRAISAFDKAGEMRYADYARLSLALTLKNALRFDESKAVLSDLLSKDSLEGNLKSQVLRGYAASFLYQRPFQGDSAIYYYNESINMSGAAPLSALDVGNLAFAYELLGESSFSDELMNEAEEIAKSDGFMGLPHIKHSISRHRGDYEEALINLEASFENHTNVLSSLTRQSLGYSLGVYYNSLAEKKEKEIERQTRLFVYCLLILISAALIIYHRAHKKRKELERTLSETEQVYWEVEALRDSNSKVSNVASLLLEGTISEMRNLADKYFLYSNKSLDWFKEKKGVATKEELLTTFRKDLESLRADRSFLNTLEIHYNLEKNNLFARLRESVTDYDRARAKNTPLLSSVDYDILLLYFSGFTIKTISYLTGVNDYVISERIYRYKDKLSFLPSKEYRLFFSKHSDSTL